MGFFEKNKKIIYRILRMYYIDNLTQSMIASKLSISRIKVARFLYFARENDLVETKLNFDISENDELESEFENKFMLKECWIVPSFEKIQDTYKYAGDNLSEILSRIIKNNSCIGIAWSNNVKDVLEYVKISKNNTVSTLATTGNIDVEGSRNNANFIAHSFSEKTGGVDYLINFPAVFDSKEAKLVMEKERNTKRIKEIANKIDINITGIGTIGAESTIFKAGYFKYDEIKYIESTGAIGSINLNFIDKNGKEVKSDFDARIIKVFPYSKFRQTENIIGIVFGVNKAQAIKAALNANLIKTLITDENTAKAVINA